MSSRKREEKHKPAEEDEVWKLLQNPGGLARHFPSPPPEDHGPSAETYTTTLTLHASAHDAGQTTRSLRGAKKH